jgi:hypothetical protein
LASDEDVEHAFRSFHRSRRRSPRSDMLIARAWGTID